MTPGRIGLALSAALHFAAGAWLLARPVPRPPTAPVELEIVVTTKPAARLGPSPAEKPAPVPEPPPAPRPAQPPRVAQAVKRRPQPPAPAVSEAVSEAVTAPAATAGPGRSAPAAPVKAADLPRAARLDLTLKSESAAGIPVLREQLEIGQAPAREPSPADLIAETQSRRRVENGLVDPYFAQLGRALIDHWNAEEHVRRSGVRGWMQQMSENSEMFTAIWQKNARRYATAGNPLSDTDVGGPAIPTVVDRTGGISNRAARDAYQRQLKEQYTARKRALFRVVQNADGTLRSVTLVEGSNEPAIDREALSDVRAAASRLPPPPPEGLGIKEPIVSLWEFQLKVSISPPVPSLSIEFDEALAFLDVRMPLDRRIYKKVKLVAVE